MSGSSVSANQATSLKLLGIVVVLFWGPMLCSVPLWYWSTLQSPIISDLPAEKSPFSEYGTYDTCHPLGLHVAASTEFTKRLQKQFPIGTPAVRVKKELYSQRFVDFDILAIVTAPDYWQKRKIRNIPPMSDADTDKEVADHISDATLRKTKMRKWLELYPGYFSTDNNTWEVSWTLDNRNNISNIHGCYRSFWRGL